MNKKSNKIWWIVGGVAILFIAALLLAKQQGWIGQKEATQVEFTSVKKSDLVETVSASGKIQPELEVSITPDVPGEIIGLYIEEGDSVKKGQLLLRIQPENYISVVERFRAGVNQAKASSEQSKSQIARAESQLLRAELDFKRQKQLFNDKVVSQSDYEISETNFGVAKQDLEAAKANYEAAKYGIRSAEANLKDASENLRKTNIYAPMNGIVSMLNVELGERVVGTSQMAGTEMLRIANLNNMEVRVNVNENDIVRVSRGDKAVIDVDAYSADDKEFMGTITQIANSANGSGGSLSANANSTEAVTEFEVRINILPESYKELLSKSRYPFKPGMTATVDIITETKTGVITVPISAVTTRTEEEKNAKPDSDNEMGPSLGAVKEETASKEKPKVIVFINDGGIAKIREVKTGITDTEAGTIEVTEGLKEGDIIISGPFVEVSKRLKEGDSVIEKKEEEKKEK
ncbi:efflux RND transporter periplasmic adaptor subunit [Arcticibacterium luteifluviistationis]|uniref:Efflux transporter periplasmic adaptor subunit n=1 Tax=Arcticibacterium luteifluviistationis TaxID=1784714 RepID=A0A2Z4GDV6_9BACT|nr:efflux RND transporter periplasmic adaptor subunit [Arcticibacterium luteifluviistationis]AWV99354.1 efflux transporter periplasmic adaptor subunit [Arcticibacterium luteifluviistationis]